MKRHFGEVKMSDFSDEYYVGVIIELMDERDRYRSKLVGDFRELCEAIEAKGVVVKKKKITKKRGVKRKRKAFDLSGRNHLVKWWNENSHINKYPSKGQKKKLIRKTGFTLIQINNWFANVRRRGLSTH